MPLSFPPTFQLSGEVGGVKELASREIRCYRTCETVWSSFASLSPLPTVMRSEQGINFLLNVDAPTLRFFRYKELSSFAFKGEEFI